MWPVRVRAGALGAGSPERDLWLSPDHAVFVEGVLIPVRYLIDGIGVAQMTVETITYYHVELARHNVMLAEALPVESYLDTGHGVLDRTGTHRGPSISPAMAWEASACARLVILGTEPETAVRRRLAAHAA